MRTWRRLVLFLAAFAVSFSATAAWAGIVKDGKKTMNNHVDGAAANVKGNSFNPRNGQCVLYSVTTTSETSHVHVETGVERCDSSTLDECDSGHLFAERWGGGSIYHCNQGGTFSNGTAYYGSSFRNTSTSTTVTGSIGSASIPQSGFGLSDTVTGRTWAEATGGSACPTSNPDGHFGHWDRYLYGTGWITVSDPWSYHTGGPGEAYGPCWTVGPSNSNGGYDVY